PLRTPEGHNIGTLAIIDYEPRTLAVWEHRVLMTLAAFVMSELELWRRLDEFSSERQTAIDDLTRRHRAERDLAERRLQALVQHAPHLMRVFGRDAKVSFANPACERVLGYAEDELFGVDAIELLLPAGAPRAEARAWLESLASEPGGVGSRP